jgi:uncharacterized repeat protein (TIGR01451 family)
MCALLGPHPPTHAKTWARPIQPKLLAQIEATGSAAVIVGFRLPGAQFRPEAAASQQRAIAQTQTALLSRLSAYAISNVKAFEQIPFVAMRLDAAALKALQADPSVTSIVEDVVLPPLVARSLPIIRADAAHLRTFRGQGQTIAILDTGIDKSHPDLAGKVVSEACFATTDPPQRWSTTCPNGQDSQTSAGAAIPPSRFVTSFDHGTHVAGIAAGVAPNANLIAIQVFSKVTDDPGIRHCANAGQRSPCLLTRSSDYLLGLQRVFSLRTSYNIAAVNMSLGGGAFPPCDGVPEFTPVRLQIDVLRSASIVTVIASGNDGYRTAVGAPACLSNAISVGATDTWPSNDVDDVADFSNMAQGVTVLAPGTPIDAAVPTSTTTCDNGSAPGDGRCFKGGTSMAAPHVAGAVAVMKSAKPNASVNEIVAALTSHGPIITDQRPGGFVSKRRLDVYAAACQLAGNCDPDDFRSLTVGQARTGTITAPETDDAYFFEGNMGQRLTLAMNRTSGNLNPFVSVWDSENKLLAFNDNGGGGVNARLDLLILPRAGRYRIVAGTNQLGLSGSYSLSASINTAGVAPVPFVRELTPISATVGSAGFWVQIHGANFVPASITRLNGNPRPMYYSSSELIWIGLYANDMLATGTHLITVFNGPPGGGSTLAPLIFSVTPAFNGFSALTAPFIPTTTVGVSTTFGISWTHPTSSWRTMQNLDFKLLGEGLNTPLWLRLSEGNPTSTLSLLNATGTPVFSGTLRSGQFGASGANEDWVISDTATLHFGQTQFFGAGRTVIVTPVVTFGAQAVGSYDLRFAVDDDAEVSEIQNADVLGRFSIAPQGCGTVLTDVVMMGADTGVVGMSQTFTASLLPSSASQPINYTWVPQPSSGQGSAQATYVWAQAGTKPIQVLAEHCAAFDADVRVVRVQTTDAPDLSMGMRGPAVARAGQPITLTITLTNSGATTATNLIGLVMLPAGAHPISGGVSLGNAVRLDVAELAAFGTAVQSAVVITANADITLSTYSVSASGGYSATGAPSVKVKLADALARLQPLTDGRLDLGAGITISLPAGAVANETTLAAYIVKQPSHVLPTGLAFAGAGFRLEAYQEDALLDEFTLSEALTVTLPLTNVWQGANAIEQTQSLYYWDGGQWRAEGVSCDAVCTVATPRMTEFVFVRAVVPPLAQHRVYLPIVHEEN